MINGTEIDLADLRMRAQRVREFTHQEGDVTFQLRHPNRFESERLWSRHRDDVVGGMRELVAVSLLGWDGVLVRDALPESKHGDDPLPFSAEAVELVLDERTDWIQAIGQAIALRMSARRESVEADRKNSQTECATSAAEAAATNSPRSVSAT